MYIGWRQPAPTRPLTRARTALKLRGGRGADQCADGMQLEDHFVRNACTELQRKEAVEVQETTSMILAGKQATQNSNRDELLALTLVCTRAPSAIAASPCLPTLAATAIASPTAQIPSRRCQQVMTSLKPCLQPPLCLCLRGAINCFHSL